MLRIAFVAALCVAVALRAFADSQTRPSPRDVDPPIGYKVRLRWTTLAPSEPRSKLLALIKRNNAKESRADIADAINAKLVDPDKVFAFLRALTRLPQKDQVKLTSGTILLDSNALYLDVASPAVVDDFTTLTGFSKLVVDGAYLELEPTMTIGTSRARDQVAASRAKIRELDARIAKLDAAKDVSAGALRRARFQVAWVWRTSQTALARQLGDKKSLADLEEAKRVIATYVVNMGNMPDDDDVAP